MRCRACLAMSSALSFVDLSDVLADDISYCDCFTMWTQLCVAEDDQLTTKLCDKCASELQHMHIFMLIARQSDAQLRRELIANRKQLWIVHTQDDTQQLKEFPVEEAVVVGEEYVEEHLMEEDDLAEIIELETVEEEAHVEFQPEKVIYDTAGHATLSNEQVGKLHATIYSCNKCAKVFENEETLKHHQRESHRATCTICELAFDGYAELVQHNDLVHDSPQDHEDADTKSTEHKGGQHCSQYLADEQNLVEHKLSIRPQQFKAANFNGNIIQETNQNRLQSPLCVHSHLPYRTQRKLKHHVKLLHTVPIHPNIVYVCGECDRHYETQTLLDNHCRLAHKPRDHVCNLCGNAFKLKNQLTNHMKLHLEKNIECPHCDKRYARNFDLDVHLRSHTGELPFACPLCEKRFAIKVRLTYHLQQHYGVKHNCKKCGAEFNSKQKLKAHSFKHTGMPYRCALCNKRGFPSRDTFKRHLLRVHNSMLSDQELDAMFQRNTGKTTRVRTIDELDHLDATEAADTAIDTCVS